MSFDALIADHIAALNANTEALRAVAANQERLIAGQAAAIEKVEAPAKKRETKAEKEAREKAEAAAAGGATETPTDAATEDKGNAEAASTASQATDAGAAANEGGATDEQLKATAVAWVGQAVDDAEKKARANWLQTMARGLIGEADASKLVMLTGPESKLTAEHRKKAVFFIKRAHKLKGTEHVDLAAPYDFDEAPDQDAPRSEPASSAEPEFDPLG